MRRPDFTLSRGPNSISVPSSGMPRLASISLERAANDPDAPMSFIPGVRIARSPVVLCPLAENFPR
jgi:poly-beta-hydroxyalkanoate depolymerase